MPSLFQDTIAADRSKRYIFCLSPEERKLLHDKAEEQGVHISVLIRRALRVALLEKPDLFNLFR